MSETRVFKLVSDGVAYNLELGFIPEKVEVINATKFGTNDAKVKFYYIRGLAADNALAEITADDAMVREIIAADGFKIYNEKIHKTEASITGITTANPGVVTAADHGFKTGDVVSITDVLGMTEVNNTRFEIIVVNKDSFRLKGVDTSGYTAYVSGGKAVRQDGFKGIRLGKAVMGADGDVLYIKAEMSDFYDDLGDIGLV